MSTTTVKKPTKKQLAIEYFMGKLLAEKEIYHDITIITYESDCVAIFKGRAHSPVYNYRFSNSEEVFEFVSKQKSYEYTRHFDELQRFVKYQEEKKQFKTGVILYSSWGYEQTNIDFYQITERKKDFVILQKIGAKKSYDDNFNDRGSCVADPSVKIGEPFRKKISKYASINLNTYSWCGLWDGRSLGWSSYA